MKILTTILAILIQTTLIFSQERQIKSVWIGWQIDKESSDSCINEKLTYYSNGDYQVDLINCDSSSISTFEYNRDKVTLSESLIKNGVRQFQLSYNYDNNGLLDSIVSSSKDNDSIIFISTKRHDKDSRIIFFTEPNEEHFIKYESNLKIEYVKRDELPDLILEYTNDKLLNKKHLNSDSTILIIETFEYDSIGKLILHNLNKYEQIKYSYNADGQLTHEDEYGGKGENKKLLKSDILKYLDSYVIEKKHIDYGRYERVIRYIRIE